MLTSFEEFRAASKYFAYYRGYTFFLFGLNRRFPSWKPPLLQVEEDTASTQVGGSRGGPVGPHIAQQAKNVGEKQEVKSAVGQ